MNESVFRYLNNFVGQNEFFDNVIWFCADILVFAVFVALAYFVIAARGKRQIAIKNSVIILFSALLAWACADVIKDIFSSPRPFLVLDSVNLLFKHGGYDSFPSGHTTFFVASAVMFIFYIRRLGLFLLILALVTGTARIAAGIHWPIDIVGGFLLGGGFALLVQYSYLKYQERYGKPEHRIFDTENENKRL